MGTRGDEVRTCNGAPQGAVVEEDGSGGRTGSWEPNGSGRPREERYSAQKIGLSLTSENMVDLESYKIEGLTSTLTNNAGEVSMAFYDLIA